MPRYFFHSEDGRAHLDTEGAYLADALAARREATRYLAELLQAEEVAFWRSGKLQVAVTDEAGAAVCILTLAGFELPPPPARVGPAK